MKKQTPNLFWRNSSTCSASAANALIQECSFPIVHRAKPTVWNSPSGSIKSKQQIYLVTRTRRRRKQPAFKTCTPPNITTFVIAAFKRKKVHNRNKLQSHYYTKMVAIPLIPYKLLIAAMMRFSLRSSCLCGENILLVFLNHSLSACKTSVNPAGFFAGS